MLKEAQKLSALMEKIPYYHEDFCTPPIFAIDILNSNVADPKVLFHGQVEASTSTYTLPSWTAHAMIDCFRSMSALHRRLELRPYKIDRSDPYLELVLDVANQRKLVSGMDVSLKAEFVGIFSRIAKSLRFNENLKSLEMAVDGEFNDDQLLEIADALQNNQTLEKLSIRSSGNWGGEGAAAMIGAIVSHPTLRKIYVELGFHHPYSFVLRCNKDSESGNKLFLLYGKDTPNTHMKAMQSIMICTNQSRLVSTLSIKMRHPQSSELFSLAASQLEQNATLKSLRLCVVSEEGSPPELSSHALMEIAQAVQGNPRLEALAIRYKGCWSIKGLNALMDSLHRHDHIRNLDFQFCRKEKDDELITILDAIVGRPMLQELRLDAGTPSEVWSSQTTLMPKFIKLLLHANCKLRKSVLGNCNLSPDQLDSLLGVLPADHPLESFSIQGYLRPGGPWSLKFPKYCASRANILRYLELLYSEHEAEDLEEDILSLKNLLKIKPGLEVCVPNIQKAIQVEDGPYEDPELVALLDFHATSSKLLQDHHVSPPALLWPLIVNRANEKLNGYFSRDRRSTAIFRLVKLTCGQQDSAFTSHLVKTATLGPEYCQIHRKKVPRQHKRHRIPSSKKDLGPLVIVQASKRGRTFEVICRTKEFHEYKHGKSKKISKVLETKEIFLSSNRGDYATEEVLLKVFGSSDVFIVAEQILERGHIHFEE